MSQFILCLFGDDDFSRNHFLIDRCKSFLGGPKDEFNYMEYEGGSANMASVIDDANSFSMMAPQKVIHVKQAESIDTKSWKAIGEYAQEPNEATLFLFEFQGSAEKAKRQLKKLASFHEFKKPKPWEIKARIQDMAKAAGVKLSAKAADLMAELIGDNLHKVSGELTKLEIYKGDGQIIEVDDVAALMGRTRLVTRYELNAFVGSRNLAKALIKSHDILDSGEEPLAVLNALTNHIRQLFQVKELAKQGLRDKFECAKAIKLPPKIAGDLLAQQAKFSDVELRQALDDAFQCDLRMKSARMDKRMVLDHFIAKLVDTGSFSPPQRRKR